MKHIFAKTYCAIIGSAILVGCGTSGKWNIEGNIAGAVDKDLILQASENGRWFTIDTITTDKNGKFSYSHEPNAYPDIYRLTLDGKSLYFPIDSIESVTITADGTNFDRD